MRLAEREAERAAKRVKAAQEREAAKQLAMAQRGMTEEEKEVSRTIAVTFVIGKKRDHMRCGGVLLKSIMMSMFWKKNSLFCRN